MMRKIEDDELREIQISILSCIDQICEKQNLCYSVGAGSLIGAIRHKGFIPWDDDIDLMMPRPDYEKLITYISTHDVGLNVISCETELKYQDTFIKICDKTTKIKDMVTNIDDIDMGVFVDIFPVDGLGNSYEDAVKNSRKGMLLHLLMTCAGMKKFSLSTTHSVVYEPVRFICYLLTRFISANKLARVSDKKNKRISFSDSKYAGTVCGSYREKTILKRDQYISVSRMSFENITVNVINDYDIYLSKLYGDYMKLPPKEKQFTHHTFIAYRKEIGD